MHLLVFTLIIASTNALCAPDLPLVSEVISKLVHTGSFDLDLPLPDDCCVFAPDGTRLDYDSQAVKLYQISVIDWMNLVRGSVPDRDSWGFGYVMGYDRKSSRTGVLIRRYK